MDFAGDFTVLANLFRKKQLLDTNDARHQEIRPALLILGGLMRGVYGGGQVVALERFGLSDVFDQVIGVSTGAPTAAYFLSKQAVLGTTIYYEECTTKNFLAFTRLFGHDKSIMSTHYLAEVFRGVYANKQLDCEAISNSRSDLFIGITNVASAAGKFMNAKEVPDMISLIQASLSTAGITDGKVILDGEAWTDGAIALQFPLQRVICEYRPTDVLNELPRCKHAGYRRWTTW